MLRTPGSLSLSEETAAHRRQIETLLFSYRSRAATAVASLPDPATALVGDAAAQRDDSDGGTAGATTGKPGDGGDSGDDSAGVAANEGDKMSPAELREETVGMMAYLVLERCSLLADAGYALQAAAEALEALGEGKPLRGWDSAPGAAERGGSLLRAPSGAGSAGGGGGGGRLPEVNNGCRLVELAIVILVCCLFLYWCERWRLRWRRSGFLRLIFVEAR